MSDQTFDKELFIREFKASGKPSCKYILCTVTGQKVTCFGGNLLAKIQKYGTIENLLDTFVSREGANVGKAPKAPKEPKLKKHPKDPGKIRLLQRATKRKRGAKKDAIESVYNGKLEAKYNPTKLNLKDPTTVEKLTKESCMRPEIFLDNDRHCDGCPYFANCALPLKNLEVRKVAKPLKLKKVKKVVNKKVEKVAKKAAKPVKKVSKKVSKKTTKKKARK